MNKNMRRVLVVVSVLVALVVGMVIGGVNHLFTDEPKKPVESFNDSQFVNDSQIIDEQDVATALHLKDGQSVYVSPQNLIVMEDGKAYVRSGMVREWESDKPHPETKVLEKHIFSHKPEWPGSVKLTMTENKNGIGGPCLWFDISEVPKGVFPTVMKYDDETFKGERDFMEVDLPGSINRGWAS